MNHTEATEQMVAEKYLLDELSPEAREAFEEHLFDCPECALDLRAGTAFVREAKAQLSQMPADARAAEKLSKPGGKRSFWSLLGQPAFAAPAFAALLLVLVYQNAVTFPALRIAANQPRLVPVAPIRPAARGASRIAISADRRHGVVLPVDLPSAAEIAPGAAPAASYSIDLSDPQGKLAWSANIPVRAQPAPDEPANDHPFSLVIPGAMLRNGSYSLTVSSVSAQGQRSPVEQYLFDIVLTD